MAITTVWRLDMKEVRQMMAEVLSLPNDRVIDANNEVDVSKMSFFITVLVMAQDDLGSEIIYNGDEEVEKLSNLSELTLSLNAYGANSYDAINKLVMSMRLNFVYSRLKRLGIGYLRSSQIRSLPVTISGGKEQRAQVDLVFSISNKLNADLKRGDTVQINVEGS